MANAPPGVSGLPVLGNTVSFLRNTFEFLERCRDRGPVVATSVAGQRGYVVADPELIERVLVDDRERFPKSDLERDVVEPIVGNGLILARGDDWRRQRARLQPAFFREKILEYAPSMVDVAEETVAEWDDGERRNVHSDMTEYAMGVLVRTLLDLDLDDEIERVDEILGSITERFRTDTINGFVPDWVPTATNRRFADAVETMDDLAADAIDGRRRSADQGDDVLGRLLADDVGDDLVSDELVTMLLAGHETTALTLTFALALLARNEDAQRRLHTELDELEGPPSAADLDDLTTTEAVTNEAMRLYPPVNYMIRETSESTTLGEYELDGGASVFLPQWAVHRDPRWFDDPETFDPGRWTGDSDRPEYAFFPFGGGPRRCIGYRFATVEAKLALATLLRDYRVEPTPELSLDVVPSLTTRPDGPVMLRLRQR